MIRNAGVLTISVVMIAMKCSLALAQSPVPSILEVDIENVVEYQNDISDPSKFGINPNVTPSSGIMEFGPATVIGDIVAVNGHPPKDTFVGRP
jgi:hypothetical protein